MGEIVGERGKNGRVEVRTRECETWLFFEGCVLKGMVNTNVSMKVSRGNLYILQ